MFKFLEKAMQPEASAKTVSEHDLMVATAGLFLEVINADFEVNPEEEKQLRALLSKRFRLTDSEMDELISFAKQDRGKRQDIWQFAFRLKEHLPRRKRIDILIDLWRLIFADGRLDMYEDALIRKITELLGLDHSEMIETKIRVKKEFERQ